MRARRTARFGISIIAFGLALTACSDGSPTPPATRGATVVATGSTSQGASAPATRASTTGAISPASTTGDATPWSVGQIAFGPDGRLYGTDCELARVYRFTSSGFAKVVVGAGPGGFDNGFSGDGGPAVAAHLGCPIGVVFDANGNLFVTDHLNNRVRRVDPSGTIHTVVGNGQGEWAGDGGPATKASLLAPSCLAFDAHGNLFICDRDDGTVRKVDVHGVITTVAGTGERGYSGDGGPATKAELNQPEGLAFDAKGNLYISDSANNRVRVVDAHGVITTFAGTGVPGRKGEGVPAAQAQIADPNGLAFDAKGNLYVSDPDDHVVRRIDHRGIVTTFAGTGVPGSGGDGGPATKAGLTSPFGLQFDAQGNLYVADPDGHRIRVIAPDGTISTLAVAPGT